MLDEKYSEYFGFTPKEVRKLCDDFELPHKYDIIQEWYNGYVFGMRILLIVKCMKAWIIYRISCFSQGISKKFTSAWAKMICGI